MTDIRQTYAYKKWKENVLFRDGYKCTRCGCESNLEVHHILPLAKYPDLATELDNGITLCKKCHYEEHNKNYSDNVVDSSPSLIDNLHPFFIKLRTLTYYISYRNGIIQKFWKELPLPYSFKRWVEKAIQSFLLLFILIIASIICGWFR